jgi:hypothetical protein
MANIKGARFGSPAICATTPSFSNFTLNQTTDALEFIFEVPGGGGNITITRVGVRLGTITGTTPTYRVSLQGVSTTTGNPDGTIKGGVSPASTTFSPSGLSWSAGTWHWLTLDNSYAAAPGELLALVVDYSSGTVDGSNNASFSSVITNTLVRQFPYAIQNDATVRTKQAATSVFGYGSVSTAYGRPLETITAQTFTSATTPDEYALNLKFPATYGSTYKVAGAELFYTAGNTGLTVLMSLYDGTSTLQNETIDTDIMVNPAGPRVAEFLFDESSLTDLNFGTTTYRLAFAPQNATNSTLWIFQVAAAADWDAWPCGQDLAVSTRTDSGAWTDDATKRILADIIFADWTVAAAGGGGRVVGSSIVQPVTSGIAG